MPTRVMLEEGNCLGEELTFEEFRQISHREIWDCLTYDGCCGAPGVLFRRDDGRIGLEDSNSVYLDEGHDGDDAGSAPAAPSDAEAMSK